MHSENMILPAPAVNDFQYIVLCLYRRNTEIKRNPLKVVYVFLILIDTG